MSAKYEVFTPQYETVIVEANNFAVENDLLTFYRDGDVTGVFKEWLYFVEWRDGNAP